MPETEKAMLKPKLLVTASEGSVLVGIINLSAVEIYLHKERYSTRGAWTIAAGATLAPIEWKGGELWISAAGDDAAFQRLFGEVGRGASQQKQAEGQGQGQAPAAPAAPAAPGVPPVLPPIPPIPPIPGLPGFPWYSGF